MALQRRTRLRGSRHVMPAVQMAWWPAQQLRARMRGWSRTSLRRKARHQARCSTSQVQRTGSAQRQDLHACHGVMADVVGDQDRTLLDSHRRQEAIGDRKRLALPSEVVALLAGTL